MFKSCIKVDLNHPHPHQTECIPSRRNTTINKLCWSVNIKRLRGWREKKIFFHPLMEPSTITFEQRDWVTRRMAVFCGLRQRGSIIILENITANDGHPGHQRWSSHKSHALYNRPVTLEGWRENNAHGWFLSSVALLLISAKKASACRANSHRGCKNHNVVGKLLMATVRIHMSHSISHVLSLRR